MVLTQEMRNCYAFRAIFEEGKQTLWLIEVLFAITRDLDLWIWMQKMQGLNLRDKKDIEEDITDQPTDRHEVSQGSSNNQF